MIRLPPRSTLFPSTPLSRSVPAHRRGGRAERLVVEVRQHRRHVRLGGVPHQAVGQVVRPTVQAPVVAALAVDDFGGPADRKSTRLNSSHANISYAVFCLKKK